MAENEYNRETYKEELRHIDELLGIAILISDSSGGIKTTTQYIRATQLYTRLVAVTHSFFRLLPENRITHEQNPFWDLVSIATLARVVIEIYHAFFYIGVEKVDKEELSFRINLMHFHMNSEKYRLYKEWGAGYDVLKTFEVGLPKDQRRLMKNTFFRKFSDKYQKHLLKGKTAMHLSHAELAKRTNVLGRHFRPLYRLLSNQIHSTPFAFQSQSNVRGRGFENDAERFYITLAIQIIVKYVGRAILDMAEIFPTQLKDTFHDELTRVEVLVDKSPNNHIELDTG